MTDLDDESGWEDAFVGTYAKSRTGLEARVKAERRAGRTAKQRERTRRLPKKQINFRATEQTHGLIERLCQHLEASQTDVIELAVAELAARKLGKEAKA